MPPTRPIEERFWEKVDKRGIDDCWEWQAAKRSGYGIFYAFGKQTQAHRVSYYLYHKRKIPSGLLVCHVCDNKGCVNPHHLFLGTNADNMKDMWDKGLGPSGERSGQTTLTENQVDEIRQSYKYYSRESSSKTLAKKYKVSPATIWRIVNGVTWKDHTSIDLGALEEVVINRPGTIKIIPQSDSVPDGYYSIGYFEFESLKVIVAFKPRSKNDETETLH